MRFPSPSMAVALAALVVATVGSATAARSLFTGADVKDGSLTGADIRAGSLTVRNLSPAARARLTPSPGLAGQPGASGAAGASGVRGAVGASGARGTDGATGATGPVGPTMRAYAYVNANGTFGNSRGIVSVTVAAGSGGSVYCVTVDSEIDLAFTAPSVTRLTPYPQDSNAYIVQLRPGFTGFCTSAPHTFEVETKQQDSGQTFVSAPGAFTVLVP